MSGVATNKTPHGTPHPVASQEPPPSLGLAYCMDGFEKRTRWPLENGVVFLSSRRLSSQMPKAHSTPRPRVVRSAAAERRGGAVTVAVVRLMDQKHTNKTAGRKVRAHGFTRQRHPRQQTRPKTGRARQPHTPRTQRSSTIIRIGTGRNAACTSHRRGRICPRPLPTADW